MAHVDRMQLNFDVRANMSPYDPTSCCLPSVLQRAQYSKIFPSQSFLILKDMRHLILLWPEGTWNVSRPYVRTRPSQTVSLFPCRRPQPKGALQVFPWYQVVARNRAHSCKLLTVLVVGYSSPDHAYYSRAYHTSGHIMHELSCPFILPPDILVAVFVRNTDRLSEGDQWQAWLAPWSHLQTSHQVSCDLRAAATRVATWPKLHGTESGIATA